MDETKLELPAAAMTLSFIYHGRHAHKEIMGDCHTHATLQSLVDMRELQLRFLALVLPEGLRVHCRTLPSTLRNPPSNAACEMMSLLMRVWAVVLAGGLCPCSCNLALRSGQKPQGVHASDELKFEGFTAAFCGMQHNIVTQCRMLDRQKLLQTQRQLA